VVEETYDCPPTSWRKLTTRVVSRIEAQDEVRIWNEREALGLERTGDSGL